MPVKTQNMQTEEISALFDEVTEYLVVSEVAAAISYQRQDEAATVDRLIGAIAQGLLGLTKIVPLDLKELTVTKGEVHRWIRGATRYWVDNATSLRFKNRDDAATHTIMELLALIEYPNGDQAFTLEQLLRVIPTGLRPSNWADLCDLRSLQPSSGLAVIVERSGLTTTGASLMRYLELYAPTDYYAR